MGNSIFGVGISALNAAQAGLATAGHNISNASTPGYHRQQIVQSTNVPQFTGAGYIGQGVQVDTVKRAYSEFLDNQVLQAQTQSSQLDAYYAQIQQLDNILADANIGLSPALQEFFRGVNEVAADPASTPSRQSLLGGAEALVARFHALDRRFQEIRDGVNVQIASSVDVINAYAQQLADLNNKVALAQGNGQPPNDLLDQRDQLVAELNREIRVTTVKQGDGSYSLFIGSGQALVVGDRALALAAAPALDDPQQLEVAYVTAGTQMVLPRDSLTGGNLGGLLAFRSETLDSTQNALGRVAIGLAQSFNDQHRLGMDLNGNMGQEFFFAAQPKVIANTSNDSTSGIPSVTLSNVTNLTTSDYRLSYGAAGYSLVRLSDNAALFSNAALPQTVDGLTITAPASASAGDSWLLQPTRNGANNIGVATTDPTRIAAAAPIVTNATPSNAGSGKISAGVVDTPPPPDPSLLHDVKIEFIDSTHFSVTDNTTPTVLAASVGYDPATGATLSYNGWTVDLNGAPAAGDTFTVGPNINGVGDNRNALLLTGLQTRNTLAGNTTSYQGAYSQLVSFVGNKTREVEVGAKAQENLVTQTQQAQQSLSGVNLDEEAANLLRYQQAYQAAGKLIQVADKLFETLLSLGNG